MRKGQVGKKAFTLIEVVVVLIVASLLIGILFRVYRTTADISLRIKHQKQLWVGIVTMQTVLQNIVDTHTVDYETLSTYTRWGNPWWTQRLPLIAEDTQKATLEITASGQLVFTTYTWSALVWSASILWWDILLSGATFIVSPYRDPKIQWCTGTTVQCFNNIIHPGFWLIGKAYPRLYTQLVFPIHTFFSFLKR